MISSLCKATWFFAGAIAQLIPFLRTWNKPHLYSFYAFIRDCQGFEKIEQLYQLLENHCAHDHLIKLKLEIIYNRIVLHPSHIFQHLFCFTRLTLVEITVPVGYDIDDATISDMAHAWPHIEQLFLRSMGGWRCTLLALMPFAQHCPWLREVSIPLDFSSIPLPVDGVAQETLWHLG
ncbi:hypothetical protein B0H19DRAFT_1266855 [Mycena capillaripes]|nr:hypothetical protein B0H19DRAFT_1266855 [Mycena capillaripes]